MSTHWDVHCVTCDKGMGMHVNHGEDLMRAIVDHRKALGSLVDFIGESDFEVSRYGGQVRLNVCWLKEHVGHVLRPRNEYGRFLGDCHETIQVFKSPIEWTWIPCILHEGHEGDHVPRKS